MRIPQAVTVVEVSARDGLQSEVRVLDTASKVNFIRLLSEAGLRVIEAASFVSARAVPQLADATDVVLGIVRKPGTLYPVLVPNARGLERALAAGANAICVFAATTDAFSQHNIRCGVEESLERYRAVVSKAQAAGAWVRGYLSCCFGCPYEGPVPEARVSQLAQRLFELGCEEIALADTIGVATPLVAQQTLSAVAQAVPLERLAVHFHDTRGQALANILACLQIGISRVDAAVAGLGGCPYAPGASGNVATEDLVYMLHGLGINTGVDLERLIVAGRFICTELDRCNQSRVATAVGATRA
ncbi:MAG: hydroxymethylglutaryl-CoA lyase [Gammaproteobacteria bacterium]